MSKKCIQCQTSKFPFLLLSLSLTSAAIQVFIAQPVKAECIYEGETYQTGETVGPFICMPDSSWQPQ